MAANKDELEAPVWMDSGFFEQVLQVSQNNSLIQVTGLAITPGSGVGEHFSSIMFRAKVTYSVRNDVTKTESFIVKTMPYQGAKADAPFLKDDRIFVRENQVYSVLVDMHRLLKQAGDDTELGPRLVYSSKSPAWVLVFEDLAVRGYASKSTMLNLEETKAVILKLAKWHATSFYIGKTDPVSN
jgi:Ecdysteroid kinase-like family